MTMARDEKGFTLVELIVYSGLFVMILAIVGGFLINSIKGDALVRDSSQATQDGQLVARSLKTGIANASDIRRTLLTDDSELLVAHTRSGDAAGTANCQAWYYTPLSGGAIYWMSGPGSTPIPSPSIDPAGTTTPPGWILMLRGVTPHSTRIFTTGTGSVTLDMSVDAGDRPAVLIQTTVNQRIQQSESLACF
ncbi:MULTISPECIES: PilW family protein [unclassified Leifsonia]|uniref:PilW family protein n=1 Tax=unclassified Leifsonia TaxID=2663824 RepID=UPI0006F853D8|nr:MULTISPECIES: prepilin-type N-terminal cleavage/methylation domain-containing protein [unclassified Leifsonia]KQX07959.1 hypothetical protein ASC59_09670 [Leifsonia sp. Root1293]KRA12240.1 hypothetical protein ASD61_09670 [Leifsonia sp. Root60]